MALQHARARIRKLVAAKLTGLASTGDNVFPSRSFPLTREKLPSISVYTPEETVTSLTLATPVRLHREVSVFIEVHALQDAEVEDVLDTCALEIEVAMSQDFVLDEHQLSTQLQATTTQTLDDADVPIGVMRMIYLIPYSTTEATPDKLN